MKKLFTLTGLLAAAQLASAQFSFTDNFDSYTTTALGPQSPTWTTWSGAQGGTEDPLVTTTNAHSAPNCVYFSSVATNGGPVDCVLPFGAQFNKGTLVVDFWMFVNTGKNAYFNFQQNTTIGQVWSSDWNFNADGTLDIANQQGLSFSTTYTMNSWSHIVITAELDNSKWNLNIDGVDKGTFHNTSLAVASINIYPINGSQFYIDDISVTHTPSAATTNDIVISYLTLPGGLAGTDVSIKALLRNVGSAPVANPYISLYNNGSLVANQTFTGMNLASMDTQIVTITTPLTYASNNIIAADAQVSSSTANDDNTNNDTIVYNYTAITPAPNKKVVAEEGTGTWCGWCPRGAVFMERMAQTYPDHFVGIAVHNGDPMVVAAYDAGIGALIGGYPSALVDRLPEVDPSELEPDFITRIQIAPKAMIENGAEWSTGNDTLHVSLTTTFLQAVNSGNYKVACVLIENHVTGTGSAYNQNNYYAGGANGPMGGYESKPASVPAAQMVYDFVARDIQPSFTGLPNAYTLPAAIGYEQIHNFSFAIPSTWDRNELKIVGLFIDNTGKIDNASSTTIDEAINGGFTSIENSTPSLSAMTVFPNPAYEDATIKFTLNEITDVVVNVTTIDGKRISSRNYGALEGTQNIQIETSGWSSGIYLIEVQAGQHSQVVKLSVQ